MNKFNPKKLQHSKWTAAHPINKEKHFIVIKIQFDEQQLSVISCTLEAVMSKNQFTIKPQELKNSHVWLQGWKS